MELPEELKNLEIAGGTTEFDEFQPAKQPQRELVWVYDLLGIKVGVID